MNKFERQTAAFVSLMAAVMAALIFLAWMASGLFITPVATQDSNAANKQDFCQSISQTHARLVEKLGDAPHTSRTLRGLPAKRFVKAFNEYGDKTNLKADVVGLFVSAKAPTHILVLFETRNCVTDRLMVPLKMYVELIRQSHNLTGSVV